MNDCEYNLIMSYKGFNPDMTCRGFKYQEGETYELPEGQTAKVCARGFHACENPLDCLRYYPPANSVFHEVEQSGHLSRHDDDSKVASSRIKIGPRLITPEIIRASMGYVCQKIAAAKDKKEGCNYVSLAGGYGANIAGGNKSCLSGGERANLAGGDMASLAGGDGASIAGGDRSSLTGGEDAKIAGGDGASIAGGDGANIAGGNGADIAGGNWAKIFGGNYADIVGGAGASIAGGDGAKIVGGPDAEIVGGAWTKIVGGDSSKITGGDNASLVGGDGASIVGGDHANIVGGYRADIVGGHWAVAACRGRASVGDSGTAIVRGSDMMARGGLGAVLVLVNDAESDHSIRFHATVIIDGKRYKPGTWYGLDENGNVVEKEDVENDE